MKGFHFLSTDFTGACDLRSQRSFIRNSVKKGFICVNRDASWFSNIHILLHKKKHFYILGMKLVPVYHHLCSVRAGGGPVNHIIQDNKERKKSRCCNPDIDRNCLSHYYYLKWTRCTNCHVYMSCSVRKEGFNLAQNVPPLYVQLDVTLSLPLPLPLSLFLPLPPSLKYLLRMNWMISYLVFSQIGPFFSDVKIWYCSIAAS